MRIWQLGACTSFFLSQGWIQYTSGWSLVNDIEKLNNILTFTGNTYCLQDRIHSAKMLWKTWSDLINGRFKLDNMLLFLDPWYIWVTRPQSSEGCGLKLWSSFSPTSQVTISVSELQRIMESPFRVAIGCTCNLWSNYWQLPLWLGLCGYKYCHQGHFLGLVWY